MPDSTLPVLRRGSVAVLLLLLAVLLAVLPGRGAQPIGGTAGHAAELPARLGPGHDIRASASGPGYAFASVLDGRPVRWNPCAPVRWTANLAGAPAGALDVLRSAVARVAALSGTTWQYVGPTTTRPTSAVLPKTARASYPPVVIGWTDASSDLLARQPKGVLAMTRTAWFGVRKADGSKVAAIRAAVIAFDRTDRLPLRGAVSWHAVALHELGHAMGLAHVGDTRQLMATVLPRTVADLQNGDRAGLVKVGRPAGCVTVP
jgi:hypothetical protein